MTTDRKFQSSASPIQDMEYKVGRLLDRPKVFQMLSVQTKLKTQKLWKATSENRTEKQQLQLLLENKNKKPNLIYKALFSRLSPCELI